MNSLWQALTVSIEAFKRPEEIFTGTEKPHISIFIVEKIVEPLTFNTTSKE